MASSKTIKRRSFVQTAAVSAAAAAAAPWLVPSVALGKAGATAASERIGLAFIGPGGRGTQLVREFCARGDVQGLAVADVRSEVRQRVQKIIEELSAARAGRPGYRGVETYIDFRDVLQRGDVDGVVLASPEHWRPLMCILAAKAGKDVFSEKPFALTIGEAKAMVEAIRRYGRIFQHGTQRRSNNEWRLRDSCEMVRNGRIGKVTHAVVSVGPSPRPDLPDYSLSHNPPPREQFDWDLWLGPAPWRPCVTGGPVPGWQQFRDFGLASVGNWGAHVLDMAQWALGKDAEGPVEILPPGADGEHLTIRYADGVKIACPRTPGDSAETVVYGTAGQKIIFGVSAEKIKEKYDPTPIGPNDIKLYRPRNNDHNGNWLECMRSRKPTICNEEVAYRSGSLCILITIMDRLQRPLKYDPVKGEFPGDDEANRLLDTPKRTPWTLY